MGGGAPFLGKFQKILRKWKNFRKIPENFRKTGKFSGKWKKISGKSEKIPENRKKFLENGKIFWKMGKILGKSEKISGKWENFRKIPENFWKIGKIFRKTGGGATFWEFSGKNGEAARPFWEFSGKNGERRAPFGKFSRKDEGKFPCTTGKLVKNRQKMAKNEYFSGIFWLRPVNSTLLTRIFTERSASRTETLRKRTELFHFAQKFSGFAPFALGTRRFRTENDRNFTIFSGFFPVYHLVAQNFFWKTRKTGENQRIFLEN